MLWFNTVGTAFTSRAGTYGCQWIYKGEGDPVDLAVEACRLALEDLADFVDEATTEPWPVKRGTPPAPEAKAANVFVLMWFGDPDDPALQLDPLPLDL